MPLLESTAFGAALVFGFRHGFDWDHLAALTDLTASQRSRRRALWLATLYALGHAVMVLVLGVLAILFAAQVPDLLDDWMGRLVGVSLIALGLWIAWTAWRTRGVPPPRSRWMLLIDGARRTRRGSRPSPAPVVIEHDHPHDHGALHDHDHGHGELRQETEGRGLGLGADDQPRSSCVHGAGGTRGESVRPQETAGPRAGAVASSEPAVSAAHSHRHRHVLAPVADPFVRYGTWSSFGVGVLHGIGAETPTQVLIFATAAEATDHVSAVGVLVAFLVGLFAANTVVAVAATFGYDRLGRNRLVMGALAAVTAVFSIGVGTLSLLGRGDVLPGILI